MSPNTVASINELGRRLGVAPATVASRLRKLHISPAAIAITGSKTSPMFALDVLKTLRLDGPDTCL